YEKWVITTVLTSILIVLFNGNHVHTIITQIQASLPPGLRNIQLRRFTPNPGDYLINMDPNSRIYDHFQYES
ncbi:15956_t:CDS:1, partial [Gigaspora rosea]